MSDVKFRVGDKVIIEDTSSHHNGKSGTITEIGSFKHVYWVNVGTHGQWVTSFNGRNLRKQVNTAPNKKLLKDVVEMFKKLDVTSVTLANGDVVTVEVNEVSDDW